MRGSVVLVQHGYIDVLYHAILYNTYTCTLLIQYRIVQGYAMYLFLQTLQCKYRTCNPAVPFTFHFSHQDLIIHIKLVTLPCFFRLSITLRLCFLQAIEDGCLDEMEERQKTKKARKRKRHDDDGESSSHQKVRQFCNF